MEQKLLEALNFLDGVKVSGRENFTRLLAAMQRIEDVAKELSEKVKEA